MAQNITKFDIIECVGYAFQRTWEERAYLLRLSLFPIVIKILCYYAALLYVEPRDILRLSLFMIPAYFAEGWLMAHWARTIMTNHRWPFTPSGDLSNDRAEIKQRSNGIINGTVAFVGVNFLMAGFFATVFEILPLDINPEDADPMIGLFALFVIIAMFLLFRFTWIYIPLSVGVSFKKYLKISHSMRFNFSLIALWLVCFIPPVILMQFLGGLILTAGGEGDPSPALEIILSLIRVLFDTLKNLLVTAGIAYALLEIFKCKKT